MVTIHHFTFLLTIYFWFLFLSKASRSPLRREYIQYSAEALHRDTTRWGDQMENGWVPHLSVFGPHLSRSGISDLLVQTDIQVVAWLVGEEEADWDLLAGRSQADVDFQLGLQDPQLPQTAAVAHHHGAHRLLNLTDSEEKHSQWRQLEMQSLTAKRWHVMASHALDGSMMTVGTKFRKMWLQSVRTVVLLNATSSSSMASRSRRSASLCRYSKDASCSKKQQGF